MNKLLSTELNVYHIETGSYISFQYFRQEILMETRSINAR